MTVGRKKKMSYTDLEDHVVTWCVDQLSALRDVVAEIEDDQHIIAQNKELIFRDHAKTVESIVNLIAPLRHEEECLLEWSFNFIDEYFVFSAHED